MHYVRLFSLLAAVCDATPPSELINATGAAISRLSQIQLSEVAADSACVLSLRFLQTLTVVTDCADFVPANLQSLVAQLAVNECCPLVALEAKQLLKLLQ